MNPWDNYTPYSQSRYGQIFNPWQQTSRSQNMYDAMYRPGQFDRKGPYDTPNEAITNTGPTGVWNRFVQAGDVNNQYYHPQDNPNGWSYADDKYSPKYTNRLIGNPYYQIADYDALDPTTWAQPMPTGVPQPGPGESAFRWTSQTRGY